MFFDYIKELDLTDSEKATLEFIRLNQYSIPNMSIREIANKSHVSPATITRLVKKLGFDSFLTLKNELKQENSKLRLPDLEAHYLSDLLASQVFPEDLFERIDTIAHIILEKEKIYCVGLGNSAPIASYAQQILNTVGIDSYLMTPNNGSMILNSIKHQSIYLIFSISGETREIIDLASILSNKHIPMICVTDGVNNSLQRLSDYTISFYLEQHKVAPMIDFTSQIPPLYLIEILARRIYQLSLVDTIVNPE